MPEIYLAWLDMPNEALSGRTPRHTLDGALPKELTDEILYYIENGDSLPDLLMDAVLDRGESMEEELLGILTASEAWEAGRAHRAQLIAIEALMHRLSERAVPWYFERIEQMESREDEVAVQCAQALLLLGATIGDRLIRELNQTENPLARESYADIVSELCLEGALDSLVRHFETEWENRAFYAFCLGRMGDPRAAGVLEDALKDNDVRYLDYLAIRDAYELLGGFLELERDFSADPDYVELSKRK